MAADRRSVNGGHKRIGAVSERIRVSGCAVNVIKQLIDERY